MWSICYAMGAKLVPFGGYQIMIDNGNTLVLKEY